MFKEERKRNKWNDCWSSSKSPLSSHHKGNHLTLTYLTPTTHSEKEEKIKNKINKKGFPSLRFRPFHSSHKTAVAEHNTVTPRPLSNLPITSIKNPISTGYQISIRTFQIFLRRPSMITSASVHNNDPTLTAVPFFFFFFTKHTSLNHNNQDL